MKGDEEVPVQVGRTTLIKHLKRIVGQEARPTRRPRERNKIPKAKTESKRPSKQARTDSIGRGGGGGGDGVDDMLPQ